MPAPECSGAQCMCWWPGIQWLPIVSHVSAISGSTPSGPNTAEDCTTGVAGLPIRATAALQVDVLVLDAVVEDAIREFPHDPDLITRVVEHVPPAMIVEGDGREAAGEVDPIARLSHVGVRVANSHVVARCASGPRSTRRADASFTACATNRGHARPQAPSRLRPWTATSRTPRSTGARATGGIGRIVSARGVESEKAKNGAPYGHPIVMHAVVSVSPWAFPCSSTVPQWSWSVAGIDVAVAEDR